VSAQLDNVVIVGLGLIGGSLAQSLRKTGFARRISAYGHRDASLKKGVELGVIDDYSLDLDEALAGADLVVIGAPTLKAADLLTEVLEIVPPATVVTDVASVKSNLVSAAPDAGNFVPGHPIAGSERSGVTASRADLFEGHRVILTPTAATNPEALELVRAVWESTGAEVVEMDVAAHDAILAATSHLPHVLAYALVDALAQSEVSEDIFRFAAGGFRDFTRIASSDPVMWRDIAIANRVELLRAIDGFAEHLQRLRTAVAEADAETLHATFTAAKSARDAFVGAQRDADNRIPE
jgi:prephenate dehydrogenase